MAQPDSSLRKKSVPVVVGAFCLGVVLSSVYWNWRGQKDASVAGQSEAQIIEPSPVPVDTSLRLPSDRQVARTEHDNDEEVTEAPKPVEPGIDLGELSAAGLDSLSRASIEKLSEAAISKQIESVHSRNRSSSLDHVHADSLCEKCTSILERRADLGSCDGLTLQAALDELDHLVGVVQLIQEEEKLMHYPANRPEGDAPAIEHKEWYISYLAYHTRIAERTEPYLLLSEAYLMDLLPMRRPTKRIF